MKSYIPTVKLVSCTSDAEELIAYCARVSGNQKNPEHKKLLQYCMTNGHWSIFEQADLTVEINTTRVIAQQILRHRSFCFQEFSQRYSKVKRTFMPCQARRQDTKNRQNSFDDLPEHDKQWFDFAQGQVYDYARRVYDEALERGIAKECARFVLPGNTSTRLYMKGNVRSWIHYLKLRTDKATQKEHRDIADAVMEIFVEQFPIIGELICQQD